MEESLKIEHTTVRSMLSTLTLYKLRVEGEVRGTMVGHHWRFNPPVIDQWLCGYRGKK